MTFAFRRSSVSSGVWISNKDPFKIRHLEFQLTTLPNDSLNLTGNINVPIIKLLMSLLLNTTMALGAWDKTIL